MNDFKGRHFRGEVILWAVRWYCRYGISYRDLETMLAERGVSVDHSTIYRWVQRYAPEMEKRLRWYWKRPGFSRSWRVDETYIKVKGRWTYLYRAVDKDGKLPDTVQHRQVKYLNNVIEADHGKLKQLIRPVRGFKTLKTAYATIKGFEVMRALKKGQAKFFQFQDGIMGEVRLIERQFGIYTF